ncbi:hypothetical protein P355_3346 [Burkholderia cenocepacia KC-01]|nr:hypothetical protein P355_3346 [Burkholderia cenocepacia KC-01]
MSVPSIGAQISNVIRVRARLSSYVKAFLDARASTKSVARNKTCGKPRENA